MSGAGGPIRSCAIIAPMDKETQQKQLNENWAKFQEAKAKATAEGRAIGTFSSWQFENRLVNFDVKKRGESVQ